MKPTSIVRVALASALAIAAATFPAVSNAGSVQDASTGVQFCSAVTSISMDPAGNLSINGCTAPATGGTGGGTATAPTCSIGTSPSTVITAGGSVTLTANCSGTSPISVSWSSGNPSNPTPASPSATSTGITFANAGAYTYNLNSSNSAGSGAQQSVTITVNPASSGGGGGGSTTGCTTSPAAVFSLSANGAAGPFIARGQMASALMDKTMFDPTGLSGHIGIRTVQATGTPMYQAVQLAFSECQGDFTSMPECVISGYPENIFTQIAVGPATTGPGACTLAAGHQYYLNVRFTDRAGNNTCTIASCGVNVILTPQ